MRGTSRGRGFRSGCARWTPDTLHGYLQDAGLRIERRYGDYALGPYRPQTSDRLILVARKPER